MIQDENISGCYIHQARHSFVTRCIEKNIKINTIAYLIGDNVEQIQKTYAHILKPHLTDEIEKLYSLYED